MSAALPWLPQGTVYGALLNFRREWDLWAPQMTEAPYKAAPQAPVLYIKTANTFAPCGAAIAVPDEVDVGGTLGLVIGGFEEKLPPALAESAQAATKKEAGGLHRIAGCVLLNDLSLPHDSYYRPAIRFRNRDGFLVCGTPAAPLAPAQIAALQIDARVNGALVQTVDLATLVRDAATLLADVSAFMTLQPGDVIITGTPSGVGPLSHGDVARVEIEGIGTLSNPVEDEIVGRPA